MKNTSPPPSEEWSDVPQIDPGMSHADRRRKTLAAAHSMMRSGRELVRDLLSPMTGGYSLQGSNRVRDVSATSRGRNDEGLRRFAESAAQ